MSTKVQQGAVVVLAGLLALATLVVGGGGAAAQAGPFPDVPADHPFAADIAWLVEEGLADGHPDGTFRPAEPITRQTAAAMLQRLAEPGADLAPDGPSPFSDIGPGDPFHGEVRWLAAMGVTRGHADGTFRPTEPVSRQELMAFLHRLAGGLPLLPPNPPTFSDLGKGPLQFAVRWAAAEGIAQGAPDGTFRPGDVVTRQAAAGFLHRFSHQVDPLLPPREGLAWGVFAATSLTEGGQPVAIAGTGIVVSFGTLLGPGYLGANAGCNGMSAAYEVVGDQIITTGGAQTAIGCGEALEDQEDWVFGLLGDDPTYALDGEVLTLTAGGKVMVMDARPWPWPGYVG